MLGQKASEHQEVGLRQHRRARAIDELDAVIDNEELQALQRAVEHVYVDELLLRWIVELVRATRRAEGVAFGASVRGSLMLERTARAWALLQGRGYVVPADVERLFVPVLGHRILLTASYLAETRALGGEEALAQVMARCLELAPPPPASGWEP